MNAQTHGIDLNRFSLLRQWSCSCPATYQSKTTDELTVLLFCDVHINLGATLNLLQCLCVICGSRAEPYRLTVQRHQWHCCICSYCLNIIGSGSPPVFHECTSYSTAYVKIKRFLLCKKASHNTACQHQMCVFSTMLLGWYVGMTQNKMATSMCVKRLKLCCIWVTRKNK